MLFVLASALDGLRHQLEQAGLYGRGQSGLLRLMLRWRQGGSS